MAATVKSFSVREFSSDSICTAGQALLDLGFQQQPPPQHTSTRLRRCRVIFVDSWHHVIRCRLASAKPPTPLQNRLDANDLPSGLTQFSPIPTPCCATRDGRLCYDIIYVVLPKLWKTFRQVQRSFFFFYTTGWGCTASWVTTTTSGGSTRIPALRSCSFLVLPAMSVADLLLCATSIFNSSNIA